MSPLATNTVGSVPLTCQHCGLTGPHPATPNGIHVQLTCKGCGQFLRFANKKEKQAMAQDIRKDILKEISPARINAAVRYGVPPSAVIHAQPMEDIDGFAQRVLKAAKQLGTVLVACHNGRLFSVAPSDNPTEIANRWSRIKPEPLDSPYRPSEDAPAAGGFDPFAEPAEAAVSIKVTAQRDHDRDVLAGHFLGWDPDATDAEIEKAYHAVDRMRRIGGGATR